MPSIPPPLRLACAPALTLLLAACGGGGEAERTAVARSQDRAVALSATPAAARERPQALASVGAKELFDWAAWKYPDLLGGSYIDYPAPIPYEGKLFTVRYVPGRNAYMGLDNTNQVYVLAPFTSGLQGYGPLSVFEPMIRADSCNVYPGSCGGTTAPPGPLNGCTMPAAQALTIGNRLVARYETTGEVAATSDLQFVVEAADTFEGQAAVRTQSTITQVATVSGTQQTSTTTSRSYDQVAAGGFVASLGDDGETSFGAFRTSSRTVYNPASLNSEHGLALGQSFSKRVSGTSTTTSTGQPAQTSSFDTTQVFTYEARETITVRGRSYDTCRYREASPVVAGAYNLNWVIFGKGLSVRNRAFEGSTVTSETELVSGTFNGAPL